MVSNVCQPATSSLLVRPSTIPHPVSAATQTVALLPAAGADYATIAHWITGLCATP
jgi:hypothetical protein